MSEIVDGWLEQEDNLERDGDDIVAKGVETVMELTGDDKVRIYSNGEMAGQGRVQGVDDEFLIYEGEKIGWDQGMVKFEGTFAVYSDHFGRLYVDGPTTPWEER